MSEKKNKSIKIPVYDVNGQLDFISSVCNNFNFDVKKLLTLILADWICSFQENTSKVSGNAYQSFICYLKSTNTTYNKLQQIKDYVEHEEKQ